MRFMLGKKKEKTRNYWWFAWRPVIAKDMGDVRHVVWLQRVFKVRSAPRCISYQIYDLNEGAAPYDYPRG